MMTRFYTIGEHDTMVKMWAEGASVPAIACALNRTVHGIYYYTHKNRDDFPIRKLRVTDQERAEMRKLREQGWTYERIGKYLGISFSTVRSNILRAARIGAGA